MTKQGMETLKTPTKRRKAATKKSATPPSYEEIASLARRYWHDRGQPEGSPEQDWLRAERDLMERAS